MDRRLHIRAWIGLGLALFAWLGEAASPAQAQVVRATDLVHWSVQAEQESVRPGEVARLNFHAEIEDGWKVYAMDSPKPTIGVEIELDSLPPGWVQEGAFEQSAPKEGYDPNFQQTVRYFEDQADIRTALRASDTAAAGARQVTGTIRFQTCNEAMCYPPTRVPFSVPLAVVAAAPGQTSPREASAPSGVSSSASARADTASMAAVGPASTSGTPEEVIPETATNLRDLDAARSGGLWQFLLLAIGAGLAALLTPCVFPMIPLTVSYFTRHAHDRAGALRMATVYGLAIVITFTALGLLTALLLGAAGAQTIAANPWINVFIGVVFVVFALSLLGLFELRLPNSWLNYLNRQSTEHGGYVGVLFMGLTLTLVSFSCTAPFVGGLLAATVQGERAYPVVGMLAFSFTFALPFILFALFPRALQSLPKSGAWMNAVKVILGFIELAAALKFLSNADLIWGWGIISRPLAIAVTVVIFFLAGLYLLGKLPLSHEPDVERVGVVRLLCAIAFFGLSLYMMPGLFGAPLNKLDAYLPPRQGTDVNLFAAMPTGAPGAVHDDGLAWHTDDIEAAFDQGMQEAKPVFIDFTGYTCTNCREMEANVFTRPEVAERFRRDFVLLRLYTDGLERGEEFQRYQLETTGTVALPTYAIVDPTGRRLIARETGVVPLPEFVEFLDTGSAVYQDRSLAAR